MTSSTEVADRYRSVQDRIAQAASSVGRNPDDVRLIAVSKFQSVEKIRAMYELGHRDFGESRVQELVDKVSKLPGDIRWHFIGKLQSNKFLSAVNVCDTIHSLESDSQLKQLAQLAESRNFFIQVNIAEEPQKSGIFSKDLDAFSEKVIQYRQANVLGLMTIGPVVDSGEEMRPYFAEMRRLNQRLGLKEISMGMSNDFEVAIQEGSTQVRIGSLLFGER